MRLPATEGSAVTYWGVVGVVDVEDLDPGVADGAVATGGIRGAEIGEALMDQTSLVALESSRSLRPTSSRVIGESAGGASLTTTVTSAESLPRAELASARARARTSSFRERGMASWYGGNRAVG